MFLTSKDELWTMYETNYRHVITAPTLHKRVMSIRFWFGVTHCYTQGLVLTTFTNSEYKSNYYDFIYKFQSGITPRHREQSKETTSCVTHILLYACDYHIMTAAQL